MPGPAGSPPPYGSAGRPKKRISPLGNGKACTEIIPELPTTLKLPLAGELFPEQAEMSACYKKQATSSCCNRSSRQSHTLTHLGSVSLSLGRPSGQWRTGLRVYMTAAFNLLLATTLQMMHTLSCSAHAFETKSLADQLHEGVVWHLIETRPSAGVRSDLQWIGI